MLFKKCILSLINSKPNLNAILKILGIFQVVSYSHRQLQAQALYTAVTK